MRIFRPSSGNSSERRVAKACVSEIIASGLAYGRDA